MNVVYVFVVNANVKWATGRSLQVAAANKGCPKIARCMVIVMLANVFATLTTRATTARVMFRPKCPKGELTLTMLYAAIVDCARLVVNASAIQVITEMIVAKRISALKIALEGIVFQ